MELASVIVSCFVMRDYLCEKPDVVGIPKPLHRGHANWLRRLGPHC
jgi:hypothetical protein